MSKNEENNVIKYDFKHNENEEEFCLSDFSSEIPLEMRKRMVQNFNWLFMSDGAKEEDIHG